MRLAVRIAFLLGIAVMIALIAREGISSILALLSRAGWILLWLVPLHALPLLLDVFGWRVLIPYRMGLATLFWIAAVREAFNRLLPVANIGGEIVGIRLLVLRGVDAAVAAASVIVEVLLTIISLYLFVALGVVCLLRLTGAVQLIEDLLIGLGVSLPVIALLVALLRYGSVFERLQRMAERILGARSRALSFLGQPENLDAAIRRLYAARTRLVTAVGWQLLGLVVGSSETWLALRWLGHPVGFAASLALESLTQAARHFIFLVPAGLGVQEAGLVGFGYLLGLSSDLAIALSLAKRMREILFGLPALLTWYWVEGRRGLQHVPNRSEY
jgi:putative membrane protein